MQDLGRAVKTACLVAAWLALVGGAARAAGADGPDEIAYTPGQGLRLGRMGLTVGGYGSVDFERDEGGPARLHVEDLALFVTWDPHARLHFFAELEGEDLAAVDDQGHGGTAESRFTVERLYGDLALRDWLNLRVGKFLTPVGRWNVIHAQPLVWTTSRPLVTVRPFDPHTTGAMVFGTVYPARETLAYQLYGQFTEQLGPEPTPQRADHGAGGRLEWSRGSDWSIGASYLAFERGRDWRHLTGLDGLWTHGRFELMGEFAHVVGMHGPDRWGVYLQGVVEVAPRIFLVGRYEHDDPPAGYREVNLVVAGAAWKPWDPVIVKVEYLVADHRVADSPPGVKSSVAVLF